MKSSFIVAAASALALLSGPAFAAKSAATPTPSPTATPAAAPSPWIAPTPTPAPAAEGAAASTAAAAGSMFESGPTNYRPEGNSFGIGAGYTLPSDLSTPNTFTARFRMASGFTIEPGIQVDAAIGNSKISGGGGASQSGSSSTINLIVGAALRKPIASRNRVDIVGILTPGLAITSASNKPAGGTKTTSTTVGLGTGWGLGVEYWPTNHWSLSFNALNPLLNVATGSQKDSGTGITNSATNFFVGADFNPSVQLLTHIYY
ncbi:MAG TPA: hypothetical protein VMV18_06215 [bacterium]|nr:hypothetical protein [bacterium]